MAIIIKKGTNISEFTLSSGKKIRLLPDIMTSLTDLEMGELLEMHGGFVKKRVISDKNPRGCFIVQMSTASAESQAKEVGNEINDASAPIVVDDSPVGNRRKPGRPKRG